MSTAARALWFAVWIAIAGPAAHAASGTWDRTANIADAAKRLGVLHRREGSRGVLKFLDACYRTHMLSSEYSKGLEACMAQDFMHTQVLASIYAKVPLEQRQKLDTPSPELIASGMQQRFASAFAQYRIATPEADAFKVLVEKQGMPVFLKAVFPKSAKPQGGK